LRRQGLLSTRLTPVISKLSMKWVPGVAAARTSPFTSSNFRVQMTAWAFVCEINLYFSRVA